MKIYQLNQITLISYLSWLLPVTGLLYNVNIVMRTWLLKQPFCDRIAEGKVIGKGSGLWKQLLYIL